MKNTQTITRTPEQIKNLPVNMITLDEAALKRYDVLREGTNYMENDLIHIHGDEYAIISKKHILTREKITKLNKVLRKK